MSNVQPNWTTVIKPKTSLLSVDFHELWQYRDLYRMFVKRDIVTWYKQTILGPLWFFIQPIMTTIMFMVVFGGIAKISTDGLPQPLFYLAGICLWQYFAESLNQTSKTFIDNANVFGKVYFPRLVVPMATVTSNLVRLAIQMGLFFLVFAYYMFFYRCACAPEPVFAFDANSDFNSRRACTRIRCAVQQPHDQIPRPYFFADFYCATLDVRNARDLPAQHHRKSKAQIADAGESAHKHHGNVQVRHAWRRRIQLGRTRLQRRLCGFASRLRRDCFQPHSAHVYGHGLKQFFLVILPIYDRHRI